MRTHPYTLTEVTTMHEAAVARRSPEQLAAAGADLGAIAAAAVAAAPEQPGTDRELVTPPELAPIVEQLRDSWDDSYHAYGQLADALGIAPENAADVNDAFEEQLAQWAATGSLDYVHEQQEQNPELSFSLVTVPDEVIGKDKLYQAAHIFAKGQDGWDEAYIYNSLYDLYSDEQLCGIPVSETNGTNQTVRFVLIPSQFTDELGNTNVANQRESLNEFTREQTDTHPGIDLKIPSVLDGIAWWYTLREAQRETSGNPDKQLDVTDYKETYLRHIDLPERTPDGWAAVPYSCVLGGGRPDLFRSDVDHDDSVRVAVG